MVALSSRRTSFVLDAAGLISLLAWTALSWASNRAEPVPIAGLLATLAITWTALLTAWKHSAGIDPARLVPRIWFWALAFRLAGLAAQPVLEDDHYRFLWDGYRFAVSGDPYQHPPAKFFADESVPAGMQRVLDSVNHPDTPAIYGPVCQWAFRLAHEISPASLTPWKVILGVADLATLAILTATALPGAVLLYAWCPLLIQETAFNAHPEAIGVLAMMAAIRWAHRSRPYLAGAAMAAAIGVKATGGLLAPLILLRAGWRAWAGLATAALLLWGPFWMRGSAAEFPALARMGRDWEFNSSLFGMISWALGRDPAHFVMAAGTAGACWICATHRGSTGGWPRGEWVYGAFFLLAPVVNPWYLLWLLPFAVIRPSSWSLAALAAVSMSYVHGGAWIDGQLAVYEHPAWLRPLEYGGAALLAWAGHNWFREART